MNTLTYTILLPTLFTFNSITSCPFDCLSVVPVTAISDTDGGGVGFARSESFMEPIEPDSPDITRKTRETKVLALWQKAVDKRETLIQK